MDVLIAYEYIGDKFYGDFHCNCDWICFRGNVRSAKHAVCRFLNSKVGDNEIKIKDIRKDIVVKNVLVDEEADKFIDDYWHNEPCHQKEPKRLRK